MKKIGIDFGTTNTIVSFYDDESKNVRTYSGRGVNASSIIPSVVAYNKRNEVIIGHAAKNVMFDKKFTSHSNFKLHLLNKAKNAKVPNIQLFEDFICHVIKQYESDMQVKLEEIVITVPAVWMIEKKHMGYREAMMEVLKKHEMPIKMLVGEPVAASAYFCYKYEFQRGKPFEGNLLVIDYGGGTLDLSYCEVQNGFLRVIDIAGKGENPEDFGHAGVAFDYGVAKKLVNDKEDSKRFQRVVRNFEANKINNSEGFTSGLKDYCLDPDFSVDIFNIDDGSEDGVEVSCEEMSEVYESVVSPALKHSIEDLVKKIDRIKGQDIRSYDTTILLVGGFSNFYLVENQIREALTTNLGDFDRRLQIPISVEDRSYAISKGAALIANGLYNINVSWPFELSIMTMQHDGEKYVGIPYVLAHKGSPIQDMDKKIYIDMPMIISKDTPLIIDIGDGESKYSEIKLDSIKDKLDHGRLVNEREFLLSVHMDMNQILRLFVKGIKSGHETEIVTQID